MRTEFPYNIILYYNNTSFPNFVDFRRKRFISSIGIYTRDVVEYVHENLISSLFRI